MGIPRTLLILSPSVHGGTSWADLELSQVVPESNVPGTQLLQSEAIGSFSPNASSSGSEIIVPKLHLLAPLESLSSPSTSSQQKRHSL